MGNHRADRRGTSRRRSDLPTSVGGTVTATAAVERTTPIAGKRRAEKPSRSGRRVAPKHHGTPPVEVAARTAASPEDEATLVLPVTTAALAADAAATTYQAYRIGGVRAATGPRTAPSQPGARRSASRAPILRGVPSAPMLLGIAALAVSAGGAITATSSLSDDGFPRFSQASALSGSSDISRVSLDRQVTSRDSRRDALADAADRELRDQVEEQSRERSTALMKLTRKAQAQADKLRLNQWMIPLSGYRITARFGDSSGLWSRYHTGLDFAAPSGTVIQAIANGVVTSTGYDGAYGNKTVITLEDGTQMWYCHQTSYSVAVGQEVHAGETIGYVGSTGNVTGPHLHLEVRPGGGDPVDPYAALVVNGVTP